MSINFFEVSCQELNISSPVFGLCDDQNGDKAYTDINNPEKWIATVKNQSGKGLTFTAIDKCVINDNEQKDRGRCDGMITSVDHIYFIELKDSKYNWKKHAIAQLESTIELFIENHDIKIFRHKKAFVCNRRHSYFYTNYQEESLRFFEKHKIRLDIQGEVVLK